MVITRICTLDTEYYSQVNLFIIYIIFILGRYVFNKYAHKIKYINVGTYMVK